MFNPQHLLKAFELYDSQFVGWSWKQRDLFWRQVIGYVQRFMPSNIAMDFAQVLRLRVKNQKKPLRSFKFKNDDGSVFPLAFNSFSGLGFEYATWGCGTRNFWWQPPAQGRRSVAGGDIFKTYVEKKQRAWESYAVKVAPQPSWQLCNSVM